LYFQFSTLCDQVCSGASRAATNILYETNFTKLRRTERYRAPNFVLQHSKRNANQYTDNAKIFSQNMTILTAHIKIRAISKHFSNLSMLTQKYSDICVEIGPSIRTPTSRVLVSARGALQHTFSIGAPELSDFIER